MPIFKLTAIVLIAVFVLSSCRSTISYYRKTRDFAGEHIDRCVDEALKCDDSNWGKGYCKYDTPNTEPLSKGKPCFITKAAKELAEDVGEAGAKAQQEINRSLAPAEQYKSFTEKKDNSGLSTQALPDKEIIKKEQEPENFQAPVILRMPAKPPENIIPEKPVVQEKIKTEQKKQKKKQNNKKPVKKKSEQKKKQRPKAKPQAKPEVKPQTTNQEIPQREKTDAEVLMEKQGINPQSNPPENPAENLPQKAPETTPLPENPL